MGTTPWGCLRRHWKALWVFVEGLFWTLALGRAMIPWAGVTHVLSTRAQKCICLSLVHLLWWFTTLTALEADCQSGSKRGKPIMHFWFATHRRHSRLLFCFWDDNSTQASAGCKQKGTPALWAHAKGYFPGFHFGELCGFVTYFLILSRGKMLLLGKWITW